MQEVVLSEAACGSWSDPQEWLIGTSYSVYHSLGLPFELQCFPFPLWPLPSNLGTFVPSSHLWIFFSSVTVSSPTYPSRFSLGLSLVVFLQALCFSSPAASGGSGLRMLRVSWRLPGDEAKGERVCAIPSQDGSFLVVTKPCCPRGKQEGLPLAQRPGCRMSGTAKPWMVRVRAGLPFPQSSSAFCPMASSPPLVPVWDQYCHSRVGGERQVQHLTWGPACTCACLALLPCPIKSFWVSTVQSTFLAAF